jgi:phage portal protein BeeE
MGIFKRAELAPSAQPVKAAVGVAGIGRYSTYNVSTNSIRALALPVISRAHDEIISLVSSLPLVEYAVQWNGEMYEEMQIPGETWMRRPDPDNTRQWFIARITSDLLLHGRAFAYITRRYENGFPAAMVWIPTADVTTPDQIGPLWFGRSKEVQFNGVQLDYRHVIQFLNPNPGLLQTGFRAIEIAERLDMASKRFASFEIASGWLQQTPGTEPMSGDELGELAEAWKSARSSVNGAVAALNNAVNWYESSMDPSKLQLVEARRHQMTELANAIGVPAYLVGAPEGGGQTYANAQQARRDLWELACKPLAICIGETLSSDDILPRGRFCKLDFSVMELENELIEGNNETATIS